jgi:hypothetical protein
MLVRPCPSPRYNADATMIARLHRRQLCQERKLNIAAHSEPGITEAGRTSRARSTAAPYRLQPHPYRGHTGAHSDPYPIPARDARLMTIAASGSPAGSSPGALLLCEPVSRRDCLFVGASFESSRRSSLTRRETSLARYRDSANDGQPASTATRSGGLWASVSVQLRPLEAAVPRTIHPGGRE